MATRADDTSSTGQSAPDPRAGPIPARAAGSRELDHRIANSLQLAADFLLLQQARLKDPFARAALIDAAERLVAVGHLHAFLARHDTAAADVDLGAFLVELGELIGQTTGLRCTVQMASLWVPAAFAQQLGLAVNELAINAAKHAYARGESGDLMVEVEPDETGLRISVADHGAGLGAGFDPEGARGLGMGIVQAIVRQLGGRLLVEDHEGARFTLVLPLDGAVREPRSFLSPEG